MKKAINVIVKVLIMSDFFLNMGWGVMAPIFSIFILQNIVFSDVSQAATVAGIAALIYWIVKSVLQIPIGRYLDINHGEKDDFWFMAIGTFFLGFVPIGYLFSSQAWHIYALQVFYAIASAMIVPSWSAIFTRHIDKGREAVEWSTYSTFVGIGAGVAGGAGGIAIGFFGFNLVFIFVSAFTFLSVILLFSIQGEISPINKEIVRIPVEKIP